MGNSSRLSLMLPCSPSDSVLMRSFFLSISLLHQLPRVPALLRGHPSKLLTQALQQLVAARWYIICRVAKGTRITRTAVDVTFFSIEKPMLQVPRPSLHNSLKNGVRSGIRTHASKRDCDLHTAPWTSHAFQHSNFTFTLMNQI